MTIQTRTIGRRGPALASWQVEEEAGDCRLRDLIGALVRGEVRAFLERQEERKLARVLTNEQIADAAETGRIHMGGDDHGQSVDPKCAVEAALTSFGDGLYFVFVDDTQIETLDSLVSLRPDSEVLFLRLVALAGG